MDLVLILTSVMVPIIAGMQLKKEERKTSENNDYSYKEMTKKGYEVYKYGNFDYAYKRV